MIVVLNLLIIDIAFTILSLKRENELMCFSVFIRDYKKKCTTIRGYVGKKMFNALKNLKGILQKGTEKNLKRVL